jgi:hypothetical protein
MRSVIWIDERGWKRRSFIPDSADLLQAPYGIPAGPPDIDRLDWEDIRRQINNMLVEQGLYALEDIERSETGVAGAVSILKRYLVALYREEWKQANKTVKPS